MRSELVLGLIISFLVGVGLRTILEVELLMVVWVLVIGFAVGKVGRRKSKTFSSPYLVAFSLFIVVFSLGIVRAEIASWQFDTSPLKSSLGEYVVLKGIVAAEPDYKERTVQFYIETDTDKVLVSTNRLSDVSYGDRIKVSGKIEKPESFTTDLGRTFNYPGYLKVRGVEYKISQAKVDVLESGQGNLIIFYLLKFKHHFIQSIQNIIPEPAVGLGAGLLLGVKSALGSDIENDFRQTGIIHIVVLSGYNVMLVVSFIMYLLAFILPLHFRIIVGGFAIVSFALMVGFSATVVRASIMAVLVLLSQLISRHYNVVRALLLAGVVMIVLNPYLLIYDIGFQLSFMATLGLILVLPHLESDLLEGKGLLGWYEFLLSTVATQIAVLPLLMYHIGEISLISILVNILVLPMVPLAMLLTFITGILSLVSFTLASWFGFLATLSLNYILYIAHTFAPLPFATVSVPEFSALGLFIFYLVMGGFLLFLEKRKVKNNSMLDWVVEEELEVVDGLLKNMLREDELPIFFKK